MARRVPFSLLSRMLPASIEHSMKLLFVCGLSNNNRTISCKLIRAIGQWWPKLESQESGHHRQLMAKRVVKS